MAAVDRDRDETGRARNARPRDDAGRPLPKGAPGVERVPEDVALPPDEAVTQAQRLLDQGLPFHAHEVFEGVWKDPVTTDRELWKGLAQLAVGLTHAQRGNATGAVSLLRRGAERLVGRADTPHGLDLPGLAAAAQALADRVEGAGPAGVGPADLRLRGTPP